MPKFTWGDSAQIAECAPVNVRPSCVVAVVGVSEQHQRSGGFLQRFPSGVVYTVEFEDGSDAEVHEDHLIPLASNSDLSRCRMEDTEAERENVWGPITMTNWRETPCVKGRAATEDDANAGRAVFFFNLSGGQESRSVDLGLPRCAILHEEGEDDLPVIVIQAEEGNNGAGAVELIAGYRRLIGGSGICMLYQLELLSEPDHRFAE